MEGGEVAADERRPIVLIVEDDVNNRAVLQAVVEDIVGAATMLADGGREALEVVRQTVPDLVLLDLLIPEPDGFAVARLLKADPATARVPIIAFSASTRSEQREAAYAAGCDRFISKPFDIDVVEESIRDLLGGASGAGRIL